MFPVALASTVSAGPAPGCPGESWSLSLALLRTLASMSGSTVCQAEGTEGRGAPDVLVTIPEHEKGVCWMQRGGSFAGRHVGCGRSWAGLPRRREHS